MSEQQHSGSSSSTSTKTATEQPNTSAPVSVNVANASTGVWLVKVPKYLAKKWSEAPNNAEVGRIRITQSNNNMKDIIFHLNESLGQTVSIKIGDKTVEEKIPLEHKFITNAWGSQDVYILKQSEEGAKENLAMIGKVIKRAECKPVQNDTSYIHLKRETMKKFIEPKRQIKIADEYTQRNHFLPKSTHLQNMERKEKSKRIRKDKQQVLDLLFNAFSKHQFYNIKHLEKITQQPTSFLKDILHEICKYNGKGMHKNTWELKDEYKQINSMPESKKVAATASLSEKISEKKTYDFMEEEEDEDLDDSDNDDDDDDDMVEQM